MKEHEAKIDPPPPGTMTWSARRKAAVVIGVRSGTITRRDASERYLLSPEELAGWEAAFDRGGAPGLLEKSFIHRRVSLRSGRRRTGPRGVNLILTNP